ncbi:MAG: hypothetical protein GX868_06295 [Actinobacteria bacterium]|nr:hypothetical protein [Actinomycetota bacterium]
MTDDETASKRTDGVSTRDIRRMIAVPLIALAAVFVGVGIYQLVSGDDAPPTITTEVGGSQVERDDPTASVPPSTTVVLGDANGLEVGGDQGQVGLVPAQTEER